MGKHRIGWKKRAFFKPSSGFGSWDIHDFSGDVSFPNLTVAENIYVGREMHKYGF